MDEGFSSPPRPSYTSSIHSQEAHDQHLKRLDLLPALLRVRFFDPFGRYKYYQRERTIGPEENLGHKLSVVVLSQRGVVEQTPDFS